MKDNKKPNYFLDSGVEVISSLAGAVLGATVAGPFGVVMGASVPPILVNSFKKISNDVASRKMGKREEQKIGTGYYYALKRIELNINNGKKVREDGFLDDNNILSDSNIIIEGVTTKLQREWELKKLIFYGNFLGNISFEKDVDFNYATVLLNLIEQLSYRQLCLIAVFKEYGTPQIDLRAIESNYKNDFGNSNFNYALYSDLAGIYNMSIVKPQPPITLGVILGNGVLSNLGERLYQLMNLNEIEKKDFTIVKNDLENALNRSL